MISKKEYKILRNCYKNESVPAGDNMLLELAEHGLIEAHEVEPCSFALGFVPTRYHITTKGRQALEEYLKLRWSDIRSWIALIISIIALLKP